MGKRDLREWIIRSIILMVGLTIAHLGVTLFLLSDLGADPFNVFVQGIYRKLDLLVENNMLTHGRTHMAISFVIIILLLVVDKVYIKIGTILCMVCGGPIIDFFTWVFNIILPQKLNYPPRIMMLVAGCIILAYGMTIVIKSDAGTGPNDLVGVVIADKTHKKFGIVRLMVDATFAVIGFILGGVVGLGTIVCIALVGPVAGVFLPINEKLIGRIIDGINR